jgi:rubrerythrin
MGEMTASAEEIVTHLNSLLALDHDAIEAYEAAIERLRAVLDRDKLRSFVAHHRRHLLEISPMVREFHGQPVTEADFRRFVTKGKVVLGGVIGDRAVLQAMQSNEEAAASAYHRASIDPGIPSRVRVVLEHTLRDEREHLGWLERRLDALTPDRPAEATRRG